MITQLFLIYHQKIYARGSQVVGRNFIIEPIEFKAELKYAK